ncbi:MAG: acyl-CoA thioesterase [Aeropyrum sp.]|nr:acyl-CoA thioesterase [Aeropyrum sp.]MCE4616425.1 acyl-CoA thioesterase [Aeropyrum sp.]
MAAIHSFRGTVFWSETDAARIAHFSTFFKLCEWAEEDFYRRVAGGEAFHDVLKRGVMFPRVRAECTYRYPLHVHDDFRVDIVDVVVGGKSITYRFEVWNETHGELSAECTIVTVAVDVERFEAVEVPGEFREALVRAGARMR